jgi:hypothetical protein
MDEVLKERRDGAECPIELAEIPTRIVVGHNCRSVSQQYVRGIESAADQHGH